MKIAQVVTLVSPDGAFGGPIRVAVNQSVALQSMGHDVTIIGACRGFPKPPTQIEGVPCKLFKARSFAPSLGFSGLIAPSMVKYAAGNIDKYDVIHVHMARDLITLPVALLARQKSVPYALQTHGMIDPSSRRLAALLDLVATRRVLNSANRLFYLTVQEKTDIAKVAGAAALTSEFLPNGVPATSLRADIQRGQEVLFLARMQSRKCPEVFVDAAVALHDKFPLVDFVLVGPDEGEGRKVSDMINAADAVDYIRWEGALSPEKTLERMARSSVYVLPSINEPFPMSVLEAMSVGLPCVVTETCGLIAALRDARSVIVVKSNAKAVAEALTRLLKDSNLRTEIGERARREIRENFGTAAIAVQLAESYAGICQ